MDWPEVVQNRNCWICYNNEHNTNLTIVDSEKFLTNCEAYLDPSIIISFKNETPTSCCNYCYESAVELIILEKQIEKLRNQISELSSIFLKTVLERRNHLNKEKNDSCITSIQPRKQCVTVVNSLDHHSPVVLNNLIVKEENVGSGAKIFPPNTQEKTEIGDYVNDFRFDACEEENTVHSEVEIEVKYSYDETVSKVVNYVDKQIAQHQELSGKIGQDCQQTIKTSMADLLKCLKMPIIQLERLQLFPAKPAVMPKNSVIHILPLNMSVIAGEETVKREKDIEQNQPHKCSICGQGFFKLCDVENHEKLHYNVGNYSCSICNKSFRNHSRLKLHERFHNVKQKKSSYSSKSVKTSARKIFHSSSKRFKCSVCSKSFSGADTLKRHTNLHSQNNLFLCCSCPKTFKSSRYLKAHEKLHTGERSFKCSICSKSFRSASNLKGHKRVHTGKRNYKCSICSKSFKSSYNLKSHKWIHTGERPFKCSFCPKSLRSSRDLKHHETVRHTEDGQYKCSTCSKSFAARSYLKRHEIVHMEEKPYKCSICPKTFGNSRGLKYHVTDHTRDTPFKCSICFKSFKSARNLKFHKWVHTGGGTYKCSICSKTFANACHLKRHKLYHTTERPFKCSSCESTFKLKHQLNSHRKRMHGNNAE